MTVRERLLSIKLMEATKKDKELNNLIEVKETELKKKGCTSKENNEVLRKES